MAEEIIKDLRRLIKPLAEAAKAIVLPHTEKAPFIVCNVGKRQDLCNAFDIGLALILDKPLILTIARGARVPTRLRHLADEVVVASSFQNKTGKQKLAAAIERVIARRGRS